MSLRWIGIVVLALGCGCGGSRAKSDEPTTAKEKQAREAKASGEDRASKNWGGWRYSGDRNECFFVIGRKCFKTEAAACTAARCGKAKKCDVAGGGPATVSCK